MINALKEGTKLGGITLWGFNATQRETYNKLDLNHKQIHYLGRDTPGHGTDYSKYVRQMCGYLW